MRIKGVENKNQKEERELKRHSSFPTASYNTMVDFLSMRSSYVKRLEHASGWPTIKKLGMVHHVGLLRDNVAETSHWSARRKGSKPLEFISTFREFSKRGSVSEGPVILTF
jgi:hypothetical protein